MNLENGRFLVAPARYDSLLKDHAEVCVSHLAMKEELDAWQLVCVSERFHVIA